MWWDKWTRVSESEDVLPFDASIACFDHILSENEAKTMLATFHGFRAGELEAEYLAHEEALVGLCADLYDAHELALYVHERWVDVDYDGGWIECRGKGAMLALVRASLREHIFVDVAIREMDLLILGNFDLLLPVFGQVPAQLQPYTERRGLHLLDGDGKRYGAGH